MTDAEQLTDTAGMSPAAIEAARAAGQLDDLLGITRHKPAGEQWTADDVSRLYAEGRFVEIADAREAGKLTDLLEGKDQ